MVGVKISGHFLHFGRGLIANALAHRDKALAMLGMPSNNLRVSVTVGVRARRCQIKRTITGT